MRPRSATISECTSLSSEDRIRTEESQQADPIQRFQLIEQGFGIVRSTKYADVQRQLLDTKRTSISCSPSAENSIRRTSPVFAHLNERRMSWRQAIFSRILTEAKLPLASEQDNGDHSPTCEKRRDSSSLILQWTQRHNSSCGDIESTVADATENNTGSSENDLANQPCLSRASTAASPVELRSHEFYRSLWKKLATQIRRNQHALIGHGDKDSLMPLKEYHPTESSSAPETVDSNAAIWLSILEGNTSAHSDRELTLRNAVESGLPRSLRGRIWKYLVTRRGESTPEDTSAEAVCFESIRNYCYSDLLKRPAPLESAIIVDLGRTFPSHPYFREKFGAGQLALFNVLKAYSLLDEEVGYCQGLSFIAGVLLLHAEEKDALDLLLWLMLQAQLRKQFKENMAALQVQMYQLSRLVHDKHKDLYDHFERYELPSLYAAAWFLTFFASTFPLGFVVRVFDLVFYLGNIDVMLSIAVTLLLHQKELLLSCTSFESLNEAIKLKLPYINSTEGEKILRTALNMDISRDLLAYRVEYRVMSEEDMFSAVRRKYSSDDGETECNERKAERAQSDEVQTLIDENKALKRHNKQLSYELQISQKQLRFLERLNQDLKSRLQSAEMSADCFKCKLLKLEFQIETLEIERRNLLNAAQAGKQKDISIPTNQCPKRLANSACDFN